MKVTAWDDKAEYLMNTRKVMFNDDYLAFLVERVWKITKPVDIVDFGCGLGYLGMKLLPLLPQGSSYTGIDSSGPLLEQARGIFARTQYRALFRQADIVEMEAEPCSCDLAICQAVLMHMAEPKKIIQKMIGSAKHGGLIIGIEPHWNSAVASMHVEELEINRRVDLGVLQRLYEFDRCQSGRDGNIGLKLPVYFREAGLCSVQSRLSDAVTYLHPGLDEDSKKIIYNVLQSDSYTTPPEDKDGFIANLTGRGATAEEASAEFERETYLAQNLRDHGLEYNTVFAYHMVITWGIKP